MEELKSLNPHGTPSLAVQMGLSFERQVMRGNSKLLEYFISQTRPRGKKGTLILIGTPLGPRKVQWYE